VRLKLLLPVKGLCYSMAVVGRNLIILEAIFSFKDNK